MVTKRGADMVKQLKGRKSNSPFEVRINNKGDLSAPLSGNYINVDPSAHPNIQTTAGIEPASTERIIGHEMGHAVFGTDDDGANRMNNVNQNENPVMRELGGNDRTRY